MERDGMPNRNKAKGSALENLMVQYFRTLFGSQVARTLAGSSQDQGDLTGMPLHTTIECKSLAAIGDSVNAGLRELPLEQSNRGSRWGAVVAKRRGFGRAQDQAVVMSADQWADMLGWAAMAVELHAADAIKRTPDEWFT
jgi:hypothetical protein